MDAGARDLIATMVTHLVSATEDYNTVRDRLVADHRGKIEIRGTFKDPPKVDVYDSKFDRWMDGKKYMPVKGAVDKIVEARNNVAGYYPALMYSCDAHAMERVEQALLLIPA